MNPKTEIFALQIILAFVGTISFILGLSGIWMGPNNMNRVNAPERLDNHYRYLSGLVLGFGFTIWFYIIPRVTQATAIVRIFALMVFIGGIARVIGFFRMGKPSDLFTIFATIVELIGAPILCYCQGRVANKKLL